MTITSTHGALPTARIRHLSEYTSFDAFGPLTAEGVHTVNKFWQRHLKDDDGLFNVYFDLDKVAGLGIVGSGTSVTITWEPSGTALEGTHWSTTAPRTLTVRQGNTSATLPILLTDMGKWFFEKYLTIRITSVTNAVNGKDYDGAQLIIRPSNDPPKVDITSTGESVAGMTYQTVTFHLSYTPLAGEEPAVWWKAVGDLAPTITGSTPGYFKFAPGYDSKDISVQHDGTGDPGDSASIIADYESDQTSYSERLWDSDAGAWVTSGASSMRTVHVDENLWCHSTDIMSAGHEWEPTTTDWPFFASNPRNTLPGGVNTADHSLPIVTSESQDTSGTASVDPNTGTALEAFTVNGNYDTPNEIPYLRQSFNLLWGGGPDTGHLTKEWSRVAWRYNHWNSDESARNIELHRVGVRVRTQDRNHGVTFRTDIKGSGVSSPAVPGTASDGSTGHTVFTDSSGTKHWYWTKSATHPDDDWGVFEDGFGVGYWYKHRVDETHDYGSVGNGAEVIGTDTINPIEYPVVYDTQLSANGTPADMVTNREGVLMHSVEFQQFDSEPSAPTTHWPKAGIWWSPRGHAVLNTSSPGSHTITAS